MAKKKPRLFADEDVTPQNPLTTISEIKPGLLRLTVLRFVLRSVDVLGRIWFQPGFLAGIDKIHFARWFILEDGPANHRRRQFVFFSNYDGTWQTYLDDFIDQASMGLTAIWSNCVGFPETRYLVCGGASHAKDFKQWVRYTQVPTQVWYSAYPDLTVHEINDATEIRRGLRNVKGLEERLQWLSRL